MHGSRSTAGSSERSGWANAFACGFAVRRELRLRPLVDHALGLAYRALDPAGLHDAHFRRDADQTLDQVRELRARRVAVGAARARRALDQYRQLVENRRPRDLELVVRRERRVLEDQLLDLGRKHVDAADDQHVVRAARDLLDPPHRARSRRHEPRQIARAVANDRQRFFAERREYELALLAVGQHRAGLGVDDLGIEVVFPYGEAVLGLDAFLRDAGSNHFRESVDVDRVDVELLLDRAAHRRRPRLGAENADLERAGLGIDTLPLHLLGDGEHVRRRHHDDIRLEIDDQLHLPLGHAARHRDDRAAQLLRAVVRTQATGEESITVRDVDDIARASARGADRTRHHRRPDIDIVSRVAADSRLAAGPG